MVEQDVQRALNQELLLSSNILRGSEAGQLMEKGRQEVGLNYEYALGTTRVISLYLYFTRRRRFSSLQDDRPKRTEFNRLMLQRFTNLCSIQIDLWMVNAQQRQMEYSRFNRKQSKVLVVEEKSNYLTLRVIKCSVPTILYLQKLIVSEITRGQRSN